MNMKQAHYWEAQEQRWHNQYLEAEKMIDHLEMKVDEQKTRMKFLEDTLLEISKENNRCPRFNDAIDGIILAAMGGGHV